MTPLSRLVYNSPPAIKTGAPPAFAKTFLMAILSLGLVGFATAVVFLAFGATLDPFEALLRRMMGKDDGITDALFRFTRPVDGATFWMPPLDDEGALAI